MTNLIINIFKLCIFYSAVTLPILGCSSLDKKEFMPVYIEVPSDEYKIPENYQSYTLFFATSHRTLDILTNESRNQIRMQFKSFGESIGKENVAVWVKSPYSNDLNIELGKTYADRLHKWYNLGLNYSGGPYLIFMTHSPDVPPMDDDYAVAISFKSKDPTLITEATEFLEAKIRRKEVSKYNIQAEAYWLDLKALIIEHQDVLEEIAKEIIINLSIKKPR